MSLRATLGSLLIGISLITGAWAQTEVLFSETFTGPTRSQPEGWQSVNTPPGNHWYLRSGMLTSGNGDNIVQQDKRTYVIAEAGIGAGWSNVEIVVDAHMNQRNGDLMLVARWDENGNHYAGVYSSRNDVVTCSITRTFDGRTDVLASVDSNQDSRLPNLSNGLTRADGRTFRLVAQGDQIAFFIDQHEAVRATDNTLTTGTAGLGQQENFVFFDNFRVIGSSQATSQGFEVSSDMGQVYRLRVAENFNRELTREYQRHLEDNGFFPVILNRNADGLYEILTGTFLSEAEAERRGDFLVEEGMLFDYSVVRSNEQVSIAEELEAAAMARQAHSVRVLRTRDQAVARATEVDLIEEHGYFPVSVVEDRGEYMVLVGNFSDAEEASRLLPDLLDVGYLDADIVNTERDVLIESTSFTTGQELYSSLPESEQQEVQDLLDRMQRSATGSSTLEEMQELRRLIFELQSGYAGLRDTVETMSAAEQARSERDEKRLLIEANIENGFMGIANRLLTDYEADYPGDPAIPALRAQIDSASTPAVTLPTVPATDHLTERIDNILREADQYESNGNLQMAMTTVRNGLRDFPSNSRLRDRMSYLESRDRELNPVDELPILEQPVARDVNSAPASSGDLMQMLKDNLMIIVGVLAVLIVLVLWMRQRKSGPKKPRRKKEVVEDDEDEYEETVPDAMPDPMAVTAGSGGIGLDPSMAEQDVSALASMVVATLNANSDTQSDADSKASQETQQPEKIDLGGLNLDSDVTPVPPTPAADPMDIDFSDDEPVAPPAPTPVEPPKEETSALDLDFEMDDEPVAPSASADDSPDVMPDPLDLGFDDAPTEPMLSLDDPETTEETLAPSGASDPFADLGLDDPTPAMDDPLDFDAEETMPLSEQTLDQVLNQEEEITQSLGLDDTQPLQSPVLPTPSGKPADGLFNQVFHAADAGSQPAEWTGAYDFAQLTVVTDNLPANTEAALRFKKTSGSGSAFYTCKFPEATGRVGIEFDLCCEEKNQYLLGLYFEHEENFRQSVHTVMHKTGDTISLRLQGKSCEYEFGKWVHVKFSIDLPTGLVDGRVDGKPVAINVPMLSMTGQQLPPSLNTISIRDTLASEGTFMIANIKVTGG